MHISWKAISIFSSGIVVGLSALLFAGIIDKNGFPQKSQAQLLSVNNKNDIPFVCEACVINQDLANRLRGKDLTNSYLSNGTSGPSTIYAFPGSVDLSNTIFVNANLSN